MFKYLFSIFFLLSSFVFAMPVPEALNTVLQNSAPGKIVDLGFSKVAQADILNYNSKLTDSGGQLIYSDDPETVKDYGILYANPLLQENNRIYIYHVNGLTDADIKITAVVFNTGDTVSTLTFKAKSLPEPSKSYIALGREGVKLFYENKVLPETVSIKPGEAVLLDKELDDMQVSNEQLLGAIYDLIPNTSNLKIYILAIPSESDTVKSFFDTYYEKYATNDGYHREGTFSTNNRSTEKPYSYSTSTGIKAFEIASNKKYSQVDLPLTGIDNETGSSVELKGNYGVTYSLNIKCTNDSNSRKLAVLLNPRGGSYGGYFQITDSTGQLIYSGYAPYPDITVTDNSTAAVIALLNLAPEDNFNINFIPAGSTSTPIDILLVPVK